MTMSCAQNPSGKVYKTYLKNPATSCSPKLKHAKNYAGNAILPIIFKYPSDVKLAATNCKGLIGSDRYIYIYIGILKSKNSEIL